MVWTREGVLHEHQNNLILLLIVSHFGSVLFSLSLFPVLHVKLNEDDPNSHQLLALMGCWREKLVDKAGDSL